MLWREDVFVWNVRFLSLRFATHGGRRHLLRRFVDIFSGVLRGLDRVVKNVFVRFALWPFRRQILQVRQSLFDLRLQSFYSLPYIFLFFDSNIDQVSSIVNTAGVGVDQIVKPVG